MLLLGIIGGLAFWLTRPTASPSTERNAQTDSPDVPVQPDQPVEPAQPVVAEPPPVLPASVDEPEVPKREEIIPKRIAFLDAETGQEVVPNEAFRVRADGALEPIELLGATVSASSQASEPLVVLATFPWHLAQVVALPGSGKFTELQVGVQHCGKVIINIRGEGDVKVQSTDKLIIEPHNGALGKENREGARYNYFITNDTSSEWYYLPFDADGLRATSLPEQLFQSALRGLDGTDGSPVDFFTHPCLRFESERNLSLGTTLVGLLPSGGPYRWSSNRHLQFDPTVDSTAILAREKALSSKELPFPAGNLNDGWFRVQGGVENTVSLLLSEACSIRGSLPPNEEYETAIPRVTLYRIERPGLGGNSQNSASEVLRCTPKGSGSFAFIDITPGEYRVCASWPMRNEVHTYSQLLILSPGEDRDLGVLSPSEGSELTLTVYMRDSNGSRIESPSGESSVQLLPVQILNHGFADPLANFADFVRVRLGQEVVVKGLPQGTWTVFVPKLIELDQYIPSPIVLRSWPEPVTFELGEKGAVEFPIDVMRELRTVEITIPAPTPMPSTNFMWNLASEQSPGNLQSERVTLRPGNTATIMVELPVGKYHLFLTERGSMTQKEHAGWYGWCHFEVADGPVKPVATLAQGITVKGKVVAAENQPLKGFSVSFDLLSFSGTEESTRDQYLAFCDSDGNFIINGMPATAVLISRNTGEKILVEPSLKEIIIKH